MLNPIRLALARFLLLAPPALSLYLALRPPGGPGQAPGRVEGVLPAALLAALLLLLAGLVFSRGFRALTEGERPRLARWVWAGWGVGLLLVALSSGHLSSHLRILEDYLWMGLGLAVACWPALRAGLRRLRSREGLRNLATVLLATAVGLTLMEGLVRVWVYRFASSEIARAIADPTPAAQRGRYVPHPYLSYALRPGWVSPDGLDRHNAQGIRDGDPVPIPKPAGEFRIVAIGGSTTYGVGLARWQDAYPEQLERVLHDAYHLKAARVINLGVPGYNSWESLVNLEFRGADLEPDLVINYDGINDVHARLVRPERYVGDDTGHRRAWDASGLRLWMYDSPSHLVRFIALRLAQLKPPRIEDLVWQPDSPRRPESGAHEALLGMAPLEALQANPARYFRRNLLDMVAIQRAHAGETVLLTFAFQPDLASQKEKYAASAHYRAALAEQNALVRTLAAQLNVQSIDMAALMPQDPRYWQPDGIHLSVEGNLRFAELVAEAIHARMARQLAEADAAKRRGAR